MSELIIPKYTIVKIGGFPFKLLRDTKVMGSVENYRLAMQDQQHELRDDSERVDVPK